MDWKLWTLAIVLLLAGFLLGWFGHGAYVRGQQPTVTGTTEDTSHVPVPVADIPPVHVTPNPAPMKPRPDLAKQRKIDSLVAVVADKESLLVALAQPYNFRQEFAAEKDSSRIVGYLQCEAHPLDGIVYTDAVITELVVPERVRTIIQTVEIVRVEWKIPTIVAAVLVIVVLFLRGG